MPCRSSAVKGLLCSACGPDTRCALFVFVPISFSEIERASLSDSQLDRHRPTSLHTTSPPSPALLVSTSLSLLFCTMIFQMTSPKCCQRASLQQQSLTIPQNFTIHAFLTLPRLSSPSSRSHLSCFSDIFYSPHSTPATPHAPR